MCKPRPVTLTCRDSYPLAAGFFEASPARATVVLAPALGVPARFYARYAGFLADQGFSTLVFDYRGSGESANGPVPGRNISMQDWGRLDIDAALEWATNENASKPVFLIGHSAGAQLIGLAPASERLAGVVLVAGSAPYLSRYPLKSWPKLVPMWYLFAPLLSWRRDDFPVRKFGLGSTRVAAGVIAQWARWARTSGYLFDAAHDMDVDRYARLNLPLLSYSFSDDDFAPPGAVEALLSQYSAANIDRRLEAAPPGDSIGHFGYFRDKHKPGLWADTVALLTAALPGD